MPGRSAESAKDIEAHEPRLGYFVLPTSIRPVPGKKSLARVGQSVAAVALVAAALVKETAVQLAFKRVNVPCDRRVFRAELLGRSRKRSRSCDREKVAEVVPTLSWLTVSHRLLLINAHQLGIWRPSFNSASP